MEVENQSMGVAYHTPPEKRVEDKTGVGQVPRVVAPLGLDGSGVRSPSPSNVWVFQIVASTISLTEGVNGR